MMRRKWLYAMTIGFTMFAAGGIRDGTDDPAVEVAVLLGKLVPVRQADLALPRFDARKLGPDQAHDALPLEAGAHALCELGMGSLEFRHGGAVGKL